MAGTRGADARPQCSAGVARRGDVYVCGRRDHLSGGQRDDETARTRATFVEAGDAHGRGSKISASAERVGAPRGVVRARVAGPARPGGVARDVSPLGRRPARSMGRQDFRAHDRDRRTHGRLRHRVRGNPSPPRHSRHGRRWRLRRRCHGRRARDLRTAAAPLCANCAAPTRSSHAWRRATAASGRCCSSICWERSCDVSARSRSTCDGPPRRGGGLRSASATNTSLTARSFTA